MTTRFLADARATRALGVAFGEKVGPDAVLVLSGEMGSGKTTFVRGLAEGLGCTTRAQSPTFVLAQPHVGRLLLVHADAWRLSGADDLASLELLEQAAGGVLALEWGDRFPEVLPADVLRVDFGVTGEGRTVSFTATGPRHRPYEVWLG